MTKSTMSGRNWCRRSSAVTSRTGLSTWVCDRCSSLPWVFLALICVFLLAIDMLYVSVEVAIHFGDIMSQGCIVSGKAPCCIGIWGRCCQDFAHDSHPVKQISQVFHGVFWFVVLTWVRMLRTFGVCRHYHVKGYCCGLPRRTASGLSVSPSSRACKPSRVRLICAAGRPKTLPPMPIAARRRPLSHSPCLISSRNL